MQDMRSVYIAIMEELKPGPIKPDNKENKVDFSDIEFEIDILKTVEINLDYILSLIIEKSKESKSIEDIKEEIRRAIRSSFETKSKEELEFVNYLDSKNLNDLKKILKI